MKTRKTWDEIIKMPLGQLPRVPVEPIVGTTSAANVHFPSLYGTYCIDVLIHNLDATNTLQYRINRATRALTLEASAAVSLENVIIEQIEIAPNDTTGNYEVLPFVLPRELLYR